MMASKTDVTAMQQGLDDLNIFIDDVNASRSKRVEKLEGGSK